jgi:hypothetical protein
MDCREFRQLLQSYLDGALDGADFERMVAHEATCAACHRLASEGMPNAPVRPAVPPGAALTAEILRRTLGADCGQIQLGLAAEIDGPLPTAEAERIRLHLTECPDCRALALALKLLPEGYRAIPRLRAGAAFRREVLRRTVPTRAGFLSVLRRMWQGPALVWEGAFICSLFLTPILGRPAQEGASRLRQELHQARLGLTPTVSPADRWRELRTDLSTAGDRTEKRIEDLSVWVHRQLAVVWSGRASASDSTGVLPEGQAPASSEGGTDELRKP